MIGLKQHYQEILNELGFNFSEFVIEEADKGRLLIKGTFRGDPSLIKIYHKNPEILERVDKEFTVDRMLDRFNSKHPDSKILKTDVIQKGEAGEFVWLIRRYYNGSSLADPRGKLKDLNALFNHDLVQEKFVYSKEKILDQILNYLDSLQLIDGKFIELAGLSRNQVKPRFPLAVTNHPVTDLERQFQFSLSNQVEFFFGIKTLLLSKDNTTASVGDLLPSNIIIDKNFGVRFSDLELFCLDNRLSDLTYLWLFLWRLPDWQKYLVDRKIKTKEDKDLFRAVVIRTVTTNSEWFDRLPDNENRNNHIWVRYLKAAGESFEAIIKTK